MKDSIASLRQEYLQAELIESSAAINPLDQFQLWWEQSLQSDIYEPNAMIISTIKQNQPNSRVVLLKGLDAQGFTFYTNYNSAKGNEIAENENVSLLFFWKELERQVRIHGKAFQISEAESLAYFQSRPRSSQIGAWASDQSEEIADRSSLEKRFQDIERQYPDAIPKPPHWGGYKVKPHYFEFWQGRASRLHDRLSYSLRVGEWIRSRLSP
jgi:pyridoxamine 5'-phosphate oxidase